MTLTEQITEIVSLYSKHGWKLRRVLLSADAGGTSIQTDLGDAEFRESSFDALWFSRRSHPGSESWEIRRLFGTPFALVEVFEDGTPEEEVEERLAETEARMAETLRRGNGSA